MFSTLGAINS